MRTAGQPERWPDKNVNKLSIPKAEQVEALAKGNTYTLLEKKGIKTFDPRPFIDVSRSDVLLYFKKHADDALALLTDEKNRPFHDVVCLSKRGSEFVVYDMDHGNPRDEMYYSSLEEAATDLVAFRIGYGYPEGYGFKKK